MAHSAFFPARIHIILHYHYMLFLFLFALSAHSHTCHLTHSHAHTYILILIRYWLVDWIGLDSGLNWQMVGWIGDGGGHLVVYGYR
jgi:hypothetical protein